ncbi:GNAT family N-acetyltransferase [Streptomyces sp. NPDC051664]|uniref:GNAT family N-acetyltransferase n=1 Tax=Streptomyces sp. NPDC051664 TaxID=3365668 RepID=UPI0037BAD733
MWTRRLTDLDVDVVLVKPPGGASRRTALVSGATSLRFVDRNTTWQRRTGALKGGTCQYCGVEIRRITQVEAVKTVGHLFDDSPQQGATERFLADERHHLLIAYVDNVPAGMVTGVEMMHPDKGTEMFLYELGVDEPFRGQGVGRTLVSALADLARERDCYGMWVITDRDNAAALATYRHAGGVPEEEQVVLVWTFDQT